MSFDFKNAQMPSQQGRNAQQHPAQQTQTSSDAAQIQELMKGLSVMQGQLSALQEENRALRLNMSQSTQQKAQQTPTTPALSFNDADFENPAALSAKLREYIDTSNQQYRQSIEQAVAERVEQVLGNFAASQKQGLDFYQSNPDLRQHDSFIQHEMAHFQPNQFDQRPPEQQFEEHIRTVLNKPKADESQQSAQPYANKPAFSTPQGQGNNPQAGNMTNNSHPLSHVKNFAHLFGEKGGA